MVKNYCLITGTSDWSVSSESEGKKKTLPFYSAVFYRTVALRKSNTAAWSAVSRSLARGSTAKLWFSNGCDFCKRDMSVGSCWSSIENGRKRTARCMNRWRTKCGRPCQARQPVCNRHTLPLTPCARLRCAVASTAESYYKHRVCLVSEKSQKFKEN